MLWSSGVAGLQVGDCAVAVAPGVGVGTGGDGHGRVAVIENGQRSAQAVRGPGRGLTRLA